MKIIRGKLDMSRPLQAIKEGECLIFDHAPHQKHKDGDVFLRVDFSAYPPEDFQTFYAKRHKHKICVVNMRTGAMAFISNTRPCYAVDAVLKVED